MSDAINLIRAATEIMKTDRPLSKDFRNQAAELLSALRLCVMQLEYEEDHHREQGKAYQAPGLDKVRALLQETASE